MMKCPNDGTPLQHGIYEGSIEIDRCPQCSGVWLDQGELRQAQENRSNDYSGLLTQLDTAAQSFEFASQKAQHPDQCPKCQTTMHAEEYAYCSQILVDRCTACLGVWLDGGELQALEIFFETNQAEPDPANWKDFWAGLFR